MISFKLLKPADIHKYWARMLWTSKTTMIRTSGIVVANEDVGWKRLWYLLDQPYFMQDFKKEKSCDTV